MLTTNLLRMRVCKARIQDFIIQRDTNHPFPTFRKPQLQLPPMIPNALLLLFVLLVMRLKMENSMRQIKDSLRFSHRRLRRSQRAGG